MSTRAASRDSSRPVGVLGHPPGRQCPHPASQFPDQFRHRLQPPGPGVHGHRSSEDLHAQGIQHGSGSCSGQPSRTAARTPSPETPRFSTSRTGSPAGSQVSANDRLPTLAPVITNPQVASVGNSRRKSTSVNGAAGRFRHMLIGYARVSTADQNPDHQIDALLRAGVAATTSTSTPRTARRRPGRSSTSCSSCCVRATR